MVATDEALALRRGIGTRELPRDVVRIAGPDAIGFLQGQLSQDVAAVGVGESAFSLLLQPQGKVDAFVRLTRVGDEEVVVDTDAGWGDTVVARLNRFKLRVRCEIEPLDWRCVAVRGEGAAALAPPPPGTWRVLPETPGVPGFDLLGPDPAVPDGATPVGADAYEALRIEAGVPRMGAELDASTIPAAAGVVERSVSFTKGCFTGQELVARIDSRGGNVPRRLRGVVVATNILPPVGAVVVVEGREVGALTSVGESLERRAPVALAYVRRDVEPPADAVLRWDGGEAPARVEALPLLR
ncbi:MAG: YgfZ/GcvT domain-containing protein [Acidimicrobiales bacterium]